MERWQWQFCSGLRANVKYSRKRKREKRNEQNIVFINKFTVHCVCCLFVYLFELEETGNKRQGNEFDVHHEKYFPTSYKIQMCKTWEQVRVGALWICMSFGMVSHTRAFATHKIYRPWPSHFTTIAYSLNWCKFSLLPLQKKKNNFKKLIFVLNTLHRITERERMKKRNK